MRHRTAGTAPGKGEGALAISVEPMNGEYRYGDSEQIPTDRGEVAEAARETAKVEQYWVLAERSKPHKDYKYVEELTHLLIELSRCRTG